MEIEVLSSGSVRRVLMEHRRMQGCVQHQQLWERIARNNKRPQHKHHFSKSQAEPQVTSSQTKQSRKNLGIDENTGFENTDDKVNTPLIQINSQFCLP